MTARKTCRMPPAEWPAGKSEMQTSAHFVAQAFFGDNGNQSDVDNDTDRQYHGGPCNAVWDVAESLNQQFQRNA